MNLQQNQITSRLRRAVSVSGGSATAIHCAWSLAKLLGISDFEAFNPHALDTVQDCLQEAEALGYREGLDSEVPHWVVGTELAKAWLNGAGFRCECDADRGGTQEEWDALSEEAKDASWDRFHDLCAQGIGEDHRFYDLLMSRHLIGYAGH